MREDGSSTALAWHGKQKLAVGVGGVLTPEQCVAALRIFREHGHDAPVRLSTSTGDAECVFVVSATALAALPERAVTTELQQALGRKVWVVAASEQWPTTELLT
jgi:hypothetical protein